MILLLVSSHKFKGTGSPDGLDYCGPVWIDL
jgi:hypothetical protein